MLASVIICTRNRAVSLQRTLQSIVVAAQQVSDEDWELLVVDNGSSDDTPAVIASFADRLPVVIISEPEPGLSVARNAGVCRSRGQFVLWTDDDVLVDRNWLSAWLRAFSEHDDVVIFGGRSVPLYEEPVQTWFRDSQKALTALLAIRDSPEWQAIVHGQTPFGLNYAIRGTEQRMHRYDPNLGVAPGRRRGGEEKAMIEQLLDAGGAGCWVWDATVRHRIPATRQTEKYIRQYYVAAGYDKISTNDGKGRLIAILRALVQYGWFAVAYWYRRSKGREHAVAVLVRQSLAVGRLRRVLGLPTS